MAYIRIVGREDAIKGRTVWAIIRRVWGRSRRIHLIPARDPNSPTWGHLVQEEDGGKIVLADIYDLGGVMGKDNSGEWEE